jgi:arginase
LSLSVPHIALIGAPTDIHSSFLRGPASAPAIIRAALASDHANSFAEDGTEVGTDVLVDDVGDLPLSESASDDALIETAVRDVALSGAMPLVLGGDHAISLPVVAALVAIHGPLNILHFDAHPDIYDDFDGDPRSHASPFARIMESGYGKRLVQVGIRTMNRHCREQVARFGVEVIEMRNFAVDRVPILEGPLYISIDMDGFDPSVAPAVSHIEPGGLSTRDVLNILNRQIAPLAGADIVELNPVRDINGMTAILAAKLIRELAALHRRNGVITP